MYPATILTIVATLSTLAVAGTKVTCANHKSWVLDDDFNAAAFGYCSRADGAFLRKGFPIANTLDTKMTPSEPGAVPRNATLSFSIETSDVKNSRRLSFAQCYTIMTSFTSPSSQCHGKVNRDTRAGTLKYDTYTAKAVINPDEYI